MSGRPMISPPLFDRPIAHRGLHDRAAGIIENSAAAFERAIARGFAIECDLQLSRDGVPVIFHDDTLERLTGLAGPVGSLTADELCAAPLLGSADGATPLRLDDFLSRIGGRTLVQVELKRQPTAAMRETLVLRTLEALAGYAGPVALESFDPHVLVLLRRHQFKGPLGIITKLYDDSDRSDGVRGWRRLVLRHLLHWPWTRFGFISCYREALGLPAIRLFHALGVPVTAWTVRSAAERRLAQPGSDQIVFEGFDPDRD